MKDKSDGVTATILSIAEFALCLPLFAVTEALFLVLVAESAAVLLIVSPVIWLTAFVFSNMDDDLGVDDYMWCFFVQPVEFVGFVQGLIADAFMVRFRRAFQTRKGCDDGE